jgi:hypothetical protein
LEFSLSKLYSVRNAPNGSISQEPSMKRSNILLAFVATSALVAAGPAFARPSRNEMTPSQVKSSTLKEAQQKLNQEGYNAGRADGIWGTKTSEAVKSFQEKNKLPRTGILDEQTLADLGIGTPSSTGTSVSTKQSSEPSESSSMSTGGQQNMMHRQNMMEQDHMGGGTPSTTGRSVSETQSSQPSESSSMNTGGQQNMMHRQNMMEQDQMGGGTPSATGRSVSETQSSQPNKNSSMSTAGQQSMMQGRNMECSHYMAMNAAGQMATVNSMRSEMPAANKMPASHEMAKKVAASCKDHPGMMVQEVMENVMPRTSMMPH